jgi:hypothetical protein
VARPSLIEFPADDPERGLRFWAGFLGTDLEPRGAGEGEGWQSRGGEVAVGVHARGPGPGDRVSLPYFAVATSRPPWSGSSRSAARWSTRASAGRSAATPRAAPSGWRPPQPADERGARRSAPSSTMVTGPSFSRLTDIAAPKRPRSTGTPSSATAAA